MKINLRWTLASCNCQLLQLKHFLCAAGGHSLRMHSACQYLSSCRPGKPSEQERCAKECRSGDWKMFRVHQPNYSRRCCAERSPKPCTDGCAGRSRCRNLMFFWGLRLKDGCADRSRCRNLMFFWGLRLKDGCADRSRCRNLTFFWGSRLKDGCAGHSRCHSQSSWTNFVLTVQSGMKMQRPRKSVALCTKVLAEKKSFRQKG